MTRIRVEGGSMPVAEQYEYVKMIETKHKGAKIQDVRIVIDGDFVNIDYHFEYPEFDRIRRITGYLVGDLNRWNDGKRAEEHDRVKHGLSEV